MSRPPRVSSREGGRRAADVCRRRIDMAASPGAAARVGNLMDGAGHVLHIPPADYSMDEWWASWLLQRHARDVADLALLCDITGLGGI